MDIEPKYDSSFSLQGQLLLATPSIRQGIFHRSVVLIGEHTDEEGALGVVLNHPSQHKVGDLISSDEFQPLKNLPVHIGGPVAQEHLTFAAIWWSPKRGFRYNLRISVEDAKNHMAQPGTLVRAFVGYSGWTKGQLEDEMRMDSWFTKKPSTKLLVHQHDESLWAETLREMSPFHRLIAEATVDPFLN